MRVALTAFVIATASLASPTTASAWELLQRPNPEVEEGNSHLREGRAAEALEAYDRAAQRLPGAPELALDRGLALLAADRMDEAIESLMRAAEPRAAPNVRADAYYNRGIALMRKAEAHAEQDAHREAQDHFRLAAESFRRSLAAKPGNRDAAWNLEIALRRLRQEEEEEQQQREEEQKQDEQSEEEQQDSDEQDDSEDPQEPEEQDPDEQDQRDPDGSEDPEGEQEEPSDAQDPSEPDRGDRDTDDSSSRREQDEPSPPPDNALPEDAARILDSLQDNEENLERLRARIRAARERRQPTKDW